MITHTTIEGRKATIAYVTDDMEPASPDDATMIKIIFDDGEIRFGVKASKDRLKSQYRSEKRRALALLKVWNEGDHPRGTTGPGTTPGSFAPGGGGDGGDGDGDKGGKGGGGARSKSPHAKDPTSASSLLRIKNVSVEQIYAKVPGSKEQVAVAEAKIAEDGHETYKPYRNPDGKTYKPERRPYHAAISKKLMPPEVIERARVGPGEKPTVYIIGGRGGSGKGWFTEKGGTLEEAMKKAVYNNNDNVKAAMDEWEGWNAGVVHEEASDIATAMEAQARDQKLNIIIDATLKSKSSLEERIKLYKEAGYKISGHYMYASPDEAAKRAIGRFVHGNKKENGKGRYVRAVYTMGSLTNEENFDDHRDDMDYWEIYDNMGESPKLHSRKGGK